MTLDWTTLNDKIPVEKTEEQKAQRQAMFSEYFDANGTGFASLAECEKGVRDALFAGDDVSMENIFPKPVLMRAFMAANGVAQEKEDRPDRGVDYIEFPEFRIFLCSLKRYAEFWQIFADIDSSGGSTASDRRISVEEYRNALPKLVELGLQVDETDFARIDTNGAGYILFAEFAEWGMKQQALNGADFD
jgi:hypothetical protein